MICSPTNAYPNNNCVDGSDYEMKINFNGDYCMGADFYVYDYQTKELCNSVYYYERGATTDGFRNGEEIDIKNPRDIPQGREYVWRAKFYEKVDMDNGYYPSVFSTKGTIQKNPVLKVTVQSFPETSGVFIPVGANLDITVPCYVYWSGNGRRLVTNYHVTKGVIKINEEFDNYPPVGTELYISSVKVVSIDSIASETGLVPIECGLNIDVGTHRKSRSDTTKIPNMYLKVNNSYYGITKYYPKTGLLGLDSDITADEGTPYQIYQCFVISPYYYFTTKAAPVVTPVMTFANEVIKCEASIDTAGNYPVKYFYWTIYKNGVEINHSEKIYSGRLEYLFREIETNSTYTGKITVVTQDGVEVTSAETTCTIPDGTAGIKNLKASLVDDKNAVKLTWENVTSPTSYMILRKMSDGRIQYIETVQKRTTTYFDYSCGDGMEYEYIVIPKTSSIVYKQATVKIKTVFSDWAIYFLDEIPYERLSTTITDVRIYYNYMYGDKQFKVASAWKVQLAPKIDEITHNILREVNDPYRGKPAVTYENKDYDSFTLEFKLGALSCPDYQMTGNDLRTFKKWKQDINSQKPVMIKDSKGNVWFGAITGHTYNIDYEDSANQLYTIKIDFTQTRDMRKTRILTD